MDLPCDAGHLWTCLIIKDLAFPDANFQKPITIGAGIASLITLLGWYWIFGWLLISRVSRPAYRSRIMPGSACALASASWAAPS